MASVLLMSGNKNPVPGQIRVTREEMYAAFLRILSQSGFNAGKAATCAAVFTDNSVDGIYTHGVNRFSRFVQYTRDRLVKPDAEPSRISTFGGIEQWNGNSAAGPLNALAATERCMAISGVHGIGCLALSNTNHWMRGGYYGWKAAREGFIFIGWTNTVANMPAWGAIDAKLGNNPLVLAIPYQDEAIVLDMAMSQFSYGALELQKLKGAQLPVNGGYGPDGKLTTDPSAILASKRLLPAGFWKGAGLSLLLDILATILSAGRSTCDITKSGPETGVSQVYITISMSGLNSLPAISQTIKQIIDDYHLSMPVSEKDRILFPGERVVQTRKENMQDGIPVAKSVWQEIMALEQ